MFEPYAQKRNPAKLAQRSASDYRKMMIAEQDGRDFITGSPLTNPVIDHDHRTGHCRLILNRVTNAIEGDFNRILSRIAYREDFTPLLWEVYFGHQSRVKISLVSSASGRQRENSGERPFLVCR